MRTTIDLSYERKGALICILNDSNSIKQIVSDHQEPSRANGLLRKSLFGLSILNWAQRQVITAAASTDGAIILDRDGTVLDVACMLSKANPSCWEAEGFAEPISTPGARSGAAWHGSFYGITIKVSADGPISMYKNGRELGHID